MKKFFVVLLAMVLIASLSFSSLSQDTSETIDVYRNLVKVEVNGEGINVDNFAYEGTTYIPLRSVSEILDKNVGWNVYTHIASIDDEEYMLNELSHLLPNSQGFEWNYNGFAEYGHIMQIDNIVDEDAKREYIISGEIADPSGGEGSLDRNLDLKYIIKENKLIQEKTEETMMDSKFDKLTLIQTPLVAGTYWNEEVTDKEGNETTINAYIKKVEINDDLETEYTVRYDDANSEYYEIRTIREGVGVVNFEKLLELEDSSFPVTYFLYETKNDE